MDIEREMAGKTIRYAIVDGFEVVIYFTDGTTFEYNASDGGYSQYELRGRED